MLSNITEGGLLVFIVVLEGNLGSTANFVSSALSGVVNPNMGQVISPESQISLIFEVAPSGLNVKLKRSCSLHVSTVARGDVNNTSEVSLIEVAVLGNNNSSSIGGGVGLVAPHGT